MHCHRNSRMLTDDPMLPTPNVRFHGRSRGLSGRATAIAKALIGIYPKVSTNVREDMMAYRRVAATVFGLMRVNTYIHTKTGYLSGDKPGRPAINYYVSNYRPIRMIRYKMDFSELLNIDNSTLCGLASCVSWSGMNH